MDEQKINYRLTQRLNSRGFNFDETMENADCWSLDSFENELVVYVMFRGSYSNNILTTIPLFTESVDTQSHLVKVLTPEELAAYRQYLIRKQGGLGLGEAAIDAAPLQRAYALMVALGEI